GSILGTLNHLMVADLLWLNRMRPYPFGQVLAPLDDLPRPTALTDTLHNDLASFVPARAKLDDLIIRFVGDLRDDDLAAPFAYRSVKGVPANKTLGLVLSHVFNHQTHHRGQITTLLSQMGLDIGVTDLAPLVPDVV
ncbi:MAG: DinB family protein, partial [Asticcacaulis sp.]|nr:DinB family protein [Asticcacaulis sp.]